MATKKRDSKGRFVKVTKSADQIMMEQLAKKKREEREKQQAELEELTENNPEAAIPEDAVEMNLKRDDPMQFETPDDYDEESESGVGAAIAWAFVIILLTAACATLYCCKSIFGT